MQMDMYDMKRDMVGRVEEAFEVARGGLGRIGSSCMFWRGQTWGYVSDWTL